MRPATSSFPRCVCCTTAGACSTPRPPAHRSATPVRNGVFSNHSSVTAHSDGDIYGSGVNCDREVQPSMPAPTPSVATAVVTRRSAVAHEAGTLRIALGLRCGRNKPGPLAGVLGQIMIRSENAQNHSCTNLHYGIKCQHICSHPDMDWNFCTLSLMSTTHVTPWHSHTRHIFPGLRVCVVTP